MFLGDLVFPGQGSVVHRHLVGPSACRCMWNFIFRIFFKSLWQYAAAIWTRALLHHAGCLHALINASSLGLCACPFWPLCTIASAAHLFAPPSRSSECGLLGCCLNQPATALMIGGCLQRHIVCELDSTTVEPSEPSRVLSSAV